MRAASFGGRLPRAAVIVPARTLTEDGRRCLETRAALGDDVETLFIPDADTTELPDGVLCLPSGAVPVGDKRQLGLERARGRVITLVDDDAYPHSTWLEHVLSTLESDPEIGAVCGPTITPADVPLLEQLSGGVYESWLVSGPHRWRYAFTDARDVDDAPSVNLAFRREDALSIRFDSPYYPGGEFRPLTVTERRQVRRQRERERIDWTLRAIRHADRKTVAAAYWLAQARVLPALFRPPIHTVPRSHRAGQ